MPKRGDVLIGEAGEILYVDAVRVACVWPDRDVVLDVVRAIDVETGRVQTDLPVERTTTPKDADVELLWTDDAGPGPLVLNVFDQFSDAGWRGLPAHPTVADKILSR